jgi:hypothetical protein
MRFPTADMPLSSYSDSLTAKKFHERVKKWELRKNTRKGERRSILQNIRPLGESSVV